MTIHCSRCLFPVCGRLLEHWTCYHLMLLIEFELRMKGIR
jgi:hypothetical protein